MYSMVIQMPVAQLNEDALWARAFAARECGSLVTEHPLLVRGIKAQPQRPDPSSPASAALKQSLVHRGKEWNRLEQTQTAGRKGYKRVERVETSPVGPDPQTPSRRRCLPRPRPYSARRPAQPPPSRSAAPPPRLVA